MKSWTGCIILLAAGTTASGRTVGCSATLPWAVTWYVMAPVCKSLAADAAASQVTFRQMTASAFYRGAACLSCHELEPDQHSGPYPDTRTGQV